MIGFEDSASAMFSIDLNFYGIFEPDVSKVFIFELGLTIFEVHGIIMTFSNIGIDRKIAYPERGEVVKEMGALAGVNPVIIQSGFDDDPSLGNMSPLHRYTEGMIGCPPSAGTDKYIIFALFPELLIELTQFFSYLFAF